MKKTQFIHNDLNESINDSSRRLKPRYSYFRQALTTLITFLSFFGFIFAIQMAFYFGFKGANDEITRLECIDDKYQEEAKPYSIKETRKDFCLTQGVEIK